MTRFAWTAWAVTVLLAVAALGVRLANAPLFAEGVADPAVLLSEILYWDILIPAAVPAFATLGVVLASRRLAHGLGWLALAFAFFTVVQDLVWQYAARAVELVPGSLPGGMVAAWLNGLITPVVTVVLGALLLLRFPTGHLLSRRWRVFEWAGAAAAVLGGLNRAFGPTISAGLQTELANPLALPALGPAYLLIDTVALFTALGMVLAAAYVGAVTVFQVLLDPLTGDSQLAVAASTLAVAALFRSARRQVQGAVDRRFNRGHVDARATVDVFRSSLRDEVDLDALRAELLAATGYAVQPAAASLWLREPAPPSRDP